MALKIFAAAFGLLNGILLARLLGPAQFGVYSIVMAAVGLLSTVAALGLPSLVTREVAVHHSKEQWGLLKGLLVTSHRWVLLASLILVVVGVVAAVGFVSSYPLTVLGWSMALMLVPLTALNQLRAAILRGLHWVVAGDIPELVLRPFLVTLGIVIAYLLSVTLDGNYALLIQTTAVLGALAIGTWLLVGRIPEEISKVRSETKSRHWLHGSAVFLAITILGTLEGQIPLYLLGTLSGTENAGLFQAATQIVGIVIMGLTTVNLPLQPRLAAAWGSGDTIGAQRLVREAARLGTSLAIVAALIIIPFAEYLLSIYGQQYIDSASALRILVIGQVINAVSGSCGVVLSMTGHQRFVLIGLISALVVNLVVSWVAIAIYGLIGAALATTLSLATWNMLLIYFSWRKTGLLTFAR